MNKLTLASVEEAFQQWRAARRNRAETIPEALWSMALGLYPEHKRSIICHRLRLSGAQLKRRLEDNSHTQPHKGFVLASHDEVKSVPVPVPRTELQLIVQGQARSMTLCFDMHALAQVLPQVASLL
jgi:hypothetical protein